MTESPRRGPGRPRLGEPVQVRLDTARLDDALRPGETRQQMVRAAVEAELARRARAARRAATQT